MVPDSAILTLPVGVTENTVRVHPVVLFTICDAYIRRNENQERVIGTLLGTVGDGVVDIKNCYAVPHSESNEQVRIMLLVDGEIRIPNLVENTG